MKFKMFSDVATAFTQKPVTEKYPFVKSPAPEQVRGLLIWDADTCIGCKLCEKDCPADAIHFTIVDRKEKRFVFHYFPDRCIFCAQCVTNCRPNSLEMANDSWELAALTRGAYDVIYGKDEDIRAAMEIQAQEEA
ncbi:MAG: 4Fe-4S binding protein [Anaerolineales bacterium]|nr:4Fe-4S binding protein [Anaerolineales bacterium]